ncbi:MAG: hypothetical protein NVSMB43_22220 [Pseudarthrobacter sp.]
MTLTFDHVTLGQRVLFGTGKAAQNLASEVARLGARRVMVIASNRETPVARAVTAEIEVALWYHDIVMHVPIEVAEKARAAAAEAGVDLLVCVGGGSTTGLAKAIAMTSRLPIVAVPTTYAGSEATNVWGLTEASRKTTGVDDAVLQRSLIRERQKEPDGASSALETFNDEHSERRDVPGWGTSPRCVNRDQAARRRRHMLVLLNSLYPSTTSSAPAARSRSSGQ